MTPSLPPPGGGEADYDGLDDRIRAWKNAAQNETLMGALRKVVAFAVPGTVQDYALRPIDD